MYRNWPHYIGDIEVCPIQLPGRENRLVEKSYDTYEELAAQLIEALSPYFDRPFAFFGHCGSALPSYETVAQLQKNGLNMPAHLFISSQVAPQDGPCGRFLEMSDEELYEELKMLIVKMGGQPIPDLLELNLGVLRKDVEANKKYKPETISRLNCRLTAIGWDSDAEVAPAAMKGWKECGESVFVTLPGDHYRFLDAPGDLLHLIRERFAL